MARAHEIAIAADAREFDEGIRSGVIKPLEKAEDALKDLADAAEDAGRDGARNVGRLEDALEDAQREAKELGDDVDRTGDDIKRSMKRAEEGVDEFRDEANSTAREAAASFDGSAESIADAFQEVAANAFAGFGPAGAVAGLAAAAGIGLTMAGFESIQEAEEESKKRVGEWAQAYVEAGGRVLNAATTTAKALEIATDPEAFQKAQENAKNWGVDVSVAIAAMAGETWALEAAERALTEAERERADAYDKSSGQYGGFASSLDSASISAERGRTELDRLTGEMERGGEQADAYSRYLASVAENTEGATTKVDEFGDSVTNLPDGTTIYVDVETRRATTNVDNISKKIYGIPDGSASVRVDTWNAQRDLDGFVTRNNGREIRVRGRVTIDSGWDR